VNNRPPAPLGFCGHATGSSTFSGVIQQTGSVSLTKQFASTFVLAGTNNTFTGRLQINNGTLGVYSLADSGPGANAAAIS